MKIRRQTKVIKDDVGNDEVTSDDVTDDEKGDEWNIEDVMDDQRLTIL